MKPRASPSKGTGPGDVLLYHYTKRSTALEHILPHMSLWMGPYSQTNDPRENQRWGFGVTMSGAASKEEFYRIAHAGWDEEERIQSRLRVLSLSSDQIRPDRPIRVEDRGFGLARMWAQYSERHTGVCLVFNRDRLHREIASTVGGTEKLWWGNVDYALLAERHEHDWSAYDLDGNRIDEIGHELAVLEHVTNHLKELIFVKSEDWRDEREFRWVYLADAKESDLFVAIRDCLKEVIVGLDFNDVYLPSLRELCGKACIPVRQMHWMKGHFWEPMSVDS